MATDVTLPALGESVEEGIVLAWLVEVGDTIAVDQPLLEISTDKIDTEIPAPVGGTLVEIRAEVDDTINVGQVIAVIDESGDGAAAASPAAEAEDEPADAEPAEEQPAAEEKPAKKATADKKADTADKADKAEEAAPKPAATTAPAATTTTKAAPSEGDAPLVSPLVRKILREGGLEADQVDGSGSGGRVLRADAEAAVAAGPAPRAAASSGPASAAHAPATSRPDPSPVQIDFGGDESVTKDLTRVRKSVATSMQNSLLSTAQLTAAVEVDLTRIMAVRATHKDAFKARVGASLSPMPLIVRAAMLAIENHPTVNSRIDMEDGTATWFRDVNLGVAVDAGEKGLIVPNIKAANKLDTAGIAAAIGDLAKRARSKGLKMEDITGGTFTITNTGSLGTLFDTPILNPPEVAILATCAIEKRAVVITDEFGADQIAIRWMSYLCLTYDHRQLDGADAARYLQDVKWLCENHDFVPEVS